MTRRMLINAQRPEELRVAIIDGNTLESYKVDVAESGITRGNIYRGTIANIQPSLNAAFIDYGAERHGFLAIQDVVPDAYYRQPKGGHPRIEDVLEKNKPIVVQVVKDSVGQKGAALTTSLSVAGRYLVLTPFDNTRGVSRKVEDEDLRRKLKAIANGFDLPDGCGVIVRTNALEQTKATLTKDLSALLRLWKRVQTAAVQGKGTRLLYTDQDLILQALRDYLDNSVEEVLVDDDEAFEKAKAYMQAFMPRAKTSLIRYSDRLPLFARYGIEAQIDRVYDRQVELPSGGHIVIDPTEALTAVDVNSGRSTRAATQEETAVNTNMEAAREVARQLRLRDIGGLVVVDFIDMRASKNQRKVEKAVKDSMKIDKARSSIGRISQNGLLEINRQRIQQALQLRTHRPCPTCNGLGRLPSQEMVSLSLIRRIEAQAASGTIQGVRIRLHPELADAMQNHYRKEVAALEEEFDLQIEIIAAPGLHRPEEQVEWVRRERPLPPPKKPKQAPVTFRPWDLALPEEDEEEQEPEEKAPDSRPEEKRERRPGRGREKRGRRGGQDRGQDQAARGPRREESRGPREEVHLHREEAPPAHHEEGAVAAGAEETAESKRRKRRRGGRKKKKAGAANGQSASPEAAPFTDDAFEGGGEDHDFEHEHDDDHEPAEGVSAEGGEGGGAPARNRGRRRRRRRGGSKGGGEGAEGGGEPSPPAPLPPAGEGGGFEGL
ncbi:MAG TPA: Rne/Rng family ribonuclease [Thermoanaerobaculia bacterium]|nr:Rne/Rng family ribonuclease [Thermoanaerobaculia bacterium]